jgi:hypothetical protein
MEVWGICHSEFLDRGSECYARDEYRVVWYKLDYLVYIVSFDAGRVV